MEHKLVKQAAADLLCKYQVRSPSLDSLVFLAKQLGFEVVEYSKNKRESSATELIQELSLQSFADAGKAFVYRNQDIKLLFVCDSLSNDEKQYAIAHELGHIVCGHLKNGSSCTASMEEEYEANEFAHYLLRPRVGVRSRVWVKTHRFISVCVLVILIASIIVAFIAKRNALERTYYGEFYVTESGEKYHNKDCSVIKGKSNLHRLTIDEYESGKYAPCQVCIGDPENSEESPAD